MDNNFDPKQRRDPRVRKPLIIRFRDPQTDTHWESAQTLNVSRSGLCFYTSKQYQPKAILEIRMSSIILQKEMDYTCLVVRSFPSQKIKIFYETAVTVLDMDDASRSAFEQIIDAALQREQDRSF
jgi:hypothetical protein